MKLKIEYINQQNNLNSIIFNAAECINSRSIKHRPTKKNCYLSKNLGFQEKFLIKLSFSLIFSAKFVKFYKFCHNEITRHKPILKIKY